MTNSWTEWFALLGTVNPKIKEIGFFLFFMVILVSLLSALFIAWLYVQFCRHRATGSMIYRAFPLLGVSITAIFIAIQFSLPLSLGLLGALSIVRFRTPIKEPEEIGFIMLVCATSLCCATFNFMFLGVTLSVAVLALLILQWNGGLLKKVSGHGLLVISVPAADYTGAGPKILELLTSLLSRGRLESITENGVQTVISYRFSTAEKEALEALRQVKATTPSAQGNLFLHRTGDP